MLLTITNMRPPATDLGYLLHKNPARIHERRLAFGTATVFYPEASAERCTAALLLDIDPVGLVRRGQGAPALEQYVNDRPYIASSFLSVAIADAFGSALGGRSRERPDLVDERLPLSAHLPVVACRGGAGVVRRLFEPLGYTVFTAGHALDPTFPEWGASRSIRGCSRRDCRQQLCAGMGTAAGPVSTTTCACISSTNPPMTYPVAGGRASSRDDPAALSSICHVIV